MKRILLSLTVLMSIAIFATPSFAAWSITQSRHNFSSVDNGVNSLGVNQAGTGTGTKNVCVFCHTPHAANTGVKAPIWNRQLSMDIDAGQAYTMYSGPTLDTASTMSAKPDGVSLACLSCHDGTVALDALVNAPGSGGWRNKDGGAFTQGWTLTRGNDNTYGTTTGFIPTSQSVAGDKTLAAVAAAQGNDAYIPYLATDLSNDHPISMNYAGKINAGTGLSAAIPGKDPKFLPATAFSNRIALVDFPGADNTFATDGTIRLFNSSTTLGANYKVQCASCHNPHGTQSSATGSSAYPTFLQQSNDSSFLCRTCHIK